MFVEQATGIEPACLAWEASALPLSYICIYGETALTVRRQSGLLFTVLAFLTVILFGYAVIVLLNRFISPIKLRLSDCSVGAFLSLSVVVLGTIGLTVYLRYFNNYNAFYGRQFGKSVQNPKPCLRR